MECLKLPKNGRITSQNGQQKRVQNRMSEKYSKNDHKKGKKYSKIIK